MKIVAVRYDHPDAVKLDARVQAEYAERYGSDGDSSAMDPAEFDPPHGGYFLVYAEDGTPLASGGWRTRYTDDEGYADGDAEVKRMYVVPEARGLGLARRVLALLEAEARAAGRARMVLTTGVMQPEAMALYTSEGYEPAAVKFGPYRGYDSCRCYTKPLAPPPGADSAPVGK
ncbi:GNAT family N-acetyltransferase [Streptomyces polyrhachis]|uniref:GNAT family N-acetyltransferase n=1 Tax=Streptomyces polyrhachis TaxID=1282885 RepID=A0ABW2GI42_9ACTN